MIYMYKRKGIKMATQRHELGHKNEKRSTFTGTFERIGKKHGKSSGATILLVDIKDRKGRIVTNHLWLSYTKGLARLNSLFVGDEIQFDARVKVYQHAKASSRKKKGALLPEDYYDEYGLSHPTNFKLVHKVTPPPNKERKEIAWFAERKQFQQMINKFCKWYSWYLNSDETTK